MTARADGQPRDRPRASLAARQVDRRTILRAAAGAGLSLGLPGVLTACGKYLTFPPPTPMFALDLPNSPVGGFPALLANRARALGVEIYFDTLGTVDDFRLNVTASNSQINPVNDTYPLTYGVVAVQPTNPAGFDPVALSYLRRGGKLVSYLLPLAHQTAQITVSPSELGALLARDAAAWARTRLHISARALVVSPETSFLSSYPFLAGASAAEQAIRATFARLQPSVTITTAAGSSGAIDALRSDPATRIVLCAFDADAFVIAQMLREGHAPASRASLYVGGLGSPTPYDAEALAELRRDDVLRAIVAARPRDLADALVDLPAALLRHHAPYNLDVAPQLVTPRSAALEAFIHDYAVPAGNQSSGYLNPITSTQAIRTTT